MKEIIQERNELLQELAENAVPMIDLENEVTAPMYALAVGISFSAASIKLKKMLKDGKVTCRKVKLENGKMCMAYRKSP